MSGESHETRQQFMRRQSDVLGLPHLLSGLPVRIQLFLLIIFWLGPSAVAAVFFASMWAGWLPSPITDNNRILVRVESKMDNAIITMRREVEAGHLRDESIIRLLWATCRNVSKTETERMTCDSYWKR